MLARRSTRFLDECDKSEGSARGWRDWQKSKKEEVGGRGLDAVPVYPYTVTPGTQLLL